MYLTDLAFIEEGTPNYTEDSLVNFSKMRMVSIHPEPCWLLPSSVLIEMLEIWFGVRTTALLASQISHIIREIRQFQQTAYKIDHQPKVN